MILFSYLSDLGVPISSTENGVKVRCLLLCGTFDAPAKCLFQSFVQFNGTYGCPYCLHPGKTVKTSERGHTHAYPFNRDNPQIGHFDIRTHDQTQICKTCYSVDHNYWG